jgi:uncharacterized membrane protein HdeD (DUF308 family)
MVAVELTDSTMLVVIGLSFSIFFTAMAAWKDDTPFFSVMSGFAWMAFGIFVLYQYDVAFMFLAVITGLFMFLTGVSEYV